MSCVCRRQSHSGAFTGMITATAGTIIAASDVTILPDDAGDVDQILLMTLLIV